MRILSFYRFTYSLLATLFLLILPAMGFAQGAWVAPKGTGSISISYLNDYSNKDFFGHGENYIDVPGLGRATFFGDNRTQGVFFDFSYSFTDKLGIAASIPYLSAKWVAPPADQQVNSLVAVHVFQDGSVPLDDGNYHGDFQDLAVRVRYNLFAHPFMITPYAEFGTPSNDYLFYSHAIVGRNVKSAGIGVFLGGTLDRILPNAYLSGRYGYDWDQKVMNISRGRNLGELEFGYFITPPIRAFVIFAGQVTNGGLNAPEDFPNAPQGSADPLFFHHTQVTRDNYLNIGLGGNYSLNDRFDIFGVVTHMVAARNLHGLTYGLNFGFSWGFGGSPTRPCHC
jgi:hypothetical protein